MRYMGQDVHPLNHRSKTTETFADLVLESFPGNVLVSKLFFEFPCLIFFVSLRFG